MAFEQVRSNLSKNRSDMSDLQNQAATQKRLTKPSVDPVAAARVLTARTDIANNQQFQKGILQARSFLEYSEQSLSELNEILNRAKELAISQSSDASASASTRSVAATEVKELHSATVHLGNRKLGDRFVFGGFRTTKAPFDAYGNYRGDGGEIRIAINKDAAISMNMPGNRVFTGEIVETPKAAGPNPSSEGESAEFAPIVAGPREAERGENIEPDRAMPQNIQNNSPVMRGPASVNSSLSTSVAQSEGAFSTKGVNVFRVLSDLEIAMRTNDKLGVQEALDQIDEAMSQVTVARSIIGSRVNTLNSTLQAHQKSSVDAKGTASLLEDADTFEVVSDINKTESTLKASLETSGKLIQPSLLDFLK